MSDRLIKESDAIEAVWKPQVKPNELIFDALKQAIESEIKNCPAADRPQGKWLFDRYDTRGINRCSECGAEIKGYGKNIPFPNCPYCLARMERSEQ